MTVRAGRVVAMAGLLLGLSLVPACASQGPAASAPVVGERPTIAFLRAVGGAPSTEPTFLEELAAAGFVPGRTLTVLAGDPDEAYPDPEDARRAVRGWRDRGVDLVVALSSSGAEAARSAAPDLPVLFLSNDPTAAGLVDDEQRPPGRLTGVTFRVPADRTLDLAQRALPGLRRLGVAAPLQDPAAQAHVAALTVAAQALEVDLRVEPITDADDVGSAVAALVDQDVEVLVLSTSPTAVRLLPETRAAAEAHKLPVVANTSLAEWAVLALYPDNQELGRQLGRQAVRLLSGTTPGAVPVEDPRRYLLRVNLVVAESLGLSIPERVLVEADHVTVGAR